MSAIAIEQRGRTRGDGVQRGTRRAVMLAVVLAVVWGLWEGWRGLGIHFGITWPFAVNDTTMPHLHAIVAQLFQPSRANGPLLITVLFHAAVFTAKEAAAGFALGGIVGFLLAVALSQSRLLQRGFLPYIVASQTVPILAIAPMIVVGLGSKGITGWQAVSVTAAYLTFFPVTMNTLRGLQAADRRAVELMRSYAAGRWEIVRRLRIPSSLPYLFTALRISATASIVGAIISESSASIQDGLGGAIINFNQYYSIEPKDLWATNLVAAALGILFFLAVVVAERLVVRRAPENVA